MAKNADGDRRIRVPLHLQARHGREEVAGLLAREEIKAVLAEASEAVLDHPMGFIPLDEDQRQRDRTVSTSPRSRRLYWMAPIG